MLATWLIIFRLILSPIFPLQQTGTSPIPNCKYHKCLIPRRSASVVELIPQQKHHNSQWEKADREVGDCSFSAQFMTHYAIICLIVFLWNCHCGIVSTNNSRVVFRTKTSSMTNQRNTPLKKKWLKLSLSLWSPTFLKLVMDLTLIWWVTRINNIQIEYEYVKLSKMKKNKQETSKNNVKIEIDC